MREEMMNVAYEMIDQRVETADVMPELLDILVDIEMEYELPEDYYNEDEYFQLRCYLEDTWYEKEEAIEERLNNRYRVA